jgi:hypothetical protein
LGLGRLYEEIVLVVKIAEGKMLDSKYWMKIFDFRIIQNPKPSLRLLSNGAVNSPYFDLTPKAQCPMPGTSAYF